TPGRGGAKRHMSPRLEMPSGRIDREHRKAAVTAVGEIEESAAGMYGEVRRLVLFVESLGQRRDRLHGVQLAAVLVPTKRRHRGTALVRAIQEAVPWMKG